METNVAQKSNRNVIISLAENQKGINPVQQCSVENQKPLSE